MLKSVRTRGQIPAIRCRGARVTAPSINRTRPAASPAGLRPEGSRARKDPHADRRTLHDHRTAAACSVRRASAALIVFASNIAIVKGPTPPGTGVSAPATHATSGCTSPVTTDPRLSKAASFLEPAPNSCSTWARLVRGFIPTSTTVAPDFTKSEVTNAARPMAATRISADTATAGKSTVFEWQIVTVA